MQSISFQFVLYVYLKIPNLPCECLLAAILPYPATNLNLKHPHQHFYLILNTSEAQKF
jgi:hypothetical protein